MRIFGLAFALVLMADTATAQEPISFPTQDGGRVHALAYGTGERGVGLAHGGRFNKESWDRQCRALAEAGFRALSIDFRGYGQSRGPSTSAGVEDGRRYDVLAAVRYLRMSGVKSVSVVGASMGGDYAAEAADVEPGAIDRLVLLAAGHTRLSVG